MVLSHAIPHYTTLYHSGNRPYYLIEQILIKFSHPYLVLEHIRILKEPLFSHRTDTNFPGSPIVLEHLRFSRRPLGLEHIDLSRKVHPFELSLTCKFSLKACSLILLSVCLSVIVPFVLLCCFYFHLLFCIIMYFVFIFVFIFIYFLWWLPP